MMVSFCLSGFFFFFKQKTAYEMRISDWSSDVCSSDLRRAESLRMYSAWDLGSGKEAGRTVRCRSFGTGNRVDTADHWGLVSCFRLGARRYQLPSGDALDPGSVRRRSEEHTSDLQSLMRISYAVFCLQQKRKHSTQPTNTS